MTRLYLMADVNLKVSFNDKPVSDLLKRLFRKGENPRPALLEIGEYRFIPTPVGNTV